VSLIFFFLHLFVVIFAAVFLLLLSLDSYMDALLLVVATGAAAWQLAPT